MAYTSPLFMIAISEGELEPRPVPPCQFIHESTQATCVSTYGIELLDIAVLLDAQHESVNPQSVK